MNRLMVLALLTCSLVLSTQAEQPQVLFDGSSLDQLEFRENAWFIADDGSLACRMEAVKQKNGKVRIKGMGYAWTKSDYEDFELTLSYKLSTGANSGVFFRTDPNNPVQGGFEIQLIDDEGFQKTHGEKDKKNLNGAFYDCQAASENPAKPIGEWNQFRLRAQGTQVQIEINGVQVNEFDIAKWDTANQNPDGTPNKFKTALSELPTTGRVGFQNHGQIVWFKDIQIRALKH